MSGRVVPYPRYGAGLGLRRTTSLCARLGLDPAAWAGRSCVITGSNGKGSTASMVQAIATSHGVRTALFTSPHLHRFTERYRLGDADIQDSDLDLHWRRVQAAVEQHLCESPDDTVGGFEFIFLIALCWLEETRPDLVVFEAGIGGRYDPTRLIRAPLTALVSLDLEHTELLGPDLPSIAFDKIDACAPGGEVFAGPVPPPLEPEIAVYAALADRRVTFLRHGIDWSLREGADGGVTVATGVGPVKARLPLAGAAQAGNAALACRLAERLLGRRFDPAAAAQGLAATRWPGRLEVIRKAPLTVIDVGHSPAAVTAALEGLKLTWGGDRFSILVCGASTNKDIATLIGLLAPQFDQIVCTAAVHKGRAADDVAELARAANPGACIAVARTPDEAWTTALSMAGPDDGIYVAGGLFLAMEIRAAATGQPLTDPFF